MHPMLLAKFACCCEPSYCGACGEATFTIAASLGVAELVAVCQIPGNEYHGYEGTASWNLPDSIQVATVDVELGCEYAAATAWADVGTANPCEDNTCEPTDAFTVQFRLVAQLYHDASTGPWRVKLTLQGRCRRESDDSTSDAVDLAWAIYLEPNPSDPTACPDESEPWEPESILGVPQVSEMIDGNAAGWDCGMDTCGLFADWRQVTSTIWPSSITVAHP